MAIAAGWGLMIGTRMIYPVLLPALSAEFDLTLTTAGLLVTIVWLGYAIGQVPGGVLADRHGARRLLTAGVAIVVCGLLAVVLAPAALLLFLATGLVGVGQSLYPVARITTLSELYPDRIGRALGLTMATGDLGRTVLPPIAWRAGAGFVLPLFVLIAVVLWWILPDQAGTTSSREDLSIERLEAVLAELREPTFVPLGVILFFRGHLTDVLGVLSDLPHRSEGPLAAGREHGRNDGDGRRSGGRDAGGDERAGER